MFMDKEINKVIQLKNKYIIFYGKQKLILCDKDYEQKKDYKFPDEIIDLIELKNSNNVEIVGFNGKKCYLIQLKFKKGTVEDIVPKEIEMPSQFLIENNNSFLGFNKNEIVSYKLNLFINQNKVEKKVIIKKPCKCGILINDDLYDLNNNNENHDINYKLLIFDVKRNKEIIVIDLNEIS